jgi:hypothetical protein
VTYGSESKTRSVIRSDDDCYDDVGGLGGFIGFLQTIHAGEDAEERRSTLNWARSLGWSTRLVALQDILLALF